MKTQYEFHSYINAGELTIEPALLENLKFAARNDLRHIFDLLGSGPVEVKYGMKAQGFNGRVYQNPLPEIKSYRDKSHIGRIIKNGDFLRTHGLRSQIDDLYRPVDWHIDFKSGFRFDARRYDSREKCREVIGSKGSVDIKVPWELGRMYHMPRISLYALFCPDSRESVLREFRNQALDFMAMNPCGKTVQWSCAMDVSIRAVNLLVSYDILKQIDPGHILDDKFAELFWNCLYCHGQFVINHLEYGKLSNNHYLSNLAGLIFIGAYLDAGRGNCDIDSWLVFGTQELIEQVRLQYHMEGSQYEGSASYHRLSTEFVLYPAALIFGALKGEKKDAYLHYDKDLVDRLKGISRQRYRLDDPDFFPGDFLDKLYRAGKFTEDITKENHEIVQIGDNDSGRLLKLTTLGEVLTAKEALKKYDNLKAIEGGFYFDENILDHRSLLWAMSGLFDGGGENRRAQAAGSLEASFIRSISGKTVLPKRELYHEEPEWESIPEAAGELKYVHMKRFPARPRGKALTENIGRKLYDGFGVCIFKSDRLFLSVVTDTARHAKLLGHTHNDKLSIELMIDGELLTGDPGCYVYTAAPEARDSFRRTGAHNTARVQGREQNRMGAPFQMWRRSKAGIAACTDRSIRVWEQYDDVIHVREIEIHDDAVIVRDACNQPFSVSFCYRVWSNGYGKLLRHGE